MRKLLRKMWRVISPSRIPNTVVLVWEVHEKCTERGYNAGVRGEALESVNTKWKEECDAEEKQHITAIDNNLDKAKAEKERLEKEAKISNDERKKSITAKKFAAQNEKRIVTENNIKRVEGKIEQKENQEEGILEKIGKYEINGKTPPSNRNFFDTTTGLFTIIGGASIFEAVVNYPGFVEMSVPDAVILPTSLVLSSLIGISAHFVGQNYATKKRYTMWAWLVLGLIILSSLTFLRFGTNNNLFFSIMGFVIYAIATLVSCYRSERALYWNLKNQLDIIKSEIEKLYRELDRLKSKLDSYDERFTNEIELVVEEEKKTIKNDITIQEQIIEDLESDKKDIKVKYEKIKANGLTAIAEGFTKGKRTKSRRGNKTATILLLLTMSILSSCTKPIVSAETIGAFDKTKSQVKEDQYNATEIYKAIEQTFPFEENIYSGHKTHITTFTQSSIPDIITIELKPITNTLSRIQKQRKADIEAYKQKVKAAIKYAVELPLRDGSTSLNENICYFTNMIESSSADEKFLFIFSDGIQSSNTVNFSSRNYFKKHSYEKIADILSSDCQFGKIDDVDVTFVYNNISLNDDLLDDARKFWSFYFNAQNVKSFKHVANPMTQF